VFAGHDQQEKTISAARNHHDRNAALINC